MDNMSIENFFNDINLNRKDYIYFLFLILFGILLTVHIIKFNQLRGAFNSDIYIYLSNALNLAGMNYNNLSDPYWMFCGPLICYLTSLIFKMGYVNINAIFIVTGFFSILGILGMYTFLKVRFSPILSLTGTLIYSSLSIVLYWFSNGMLDIPAVSMSLWVLIFIIAAVDKNPKYYILASILFILMFYIRFSSAYLILVVLVYMAKKFDILDLIDNLISDRKIFKEKLFSFFYSSDFKWIVYSLILGIILMFYGFHVIWSYGGQLSFLGHATSSITGLSYSPNDPNVIFDRWFYLKNFINYLSCNHIVFNERLTEFFVEPSWFAYLIFSIFGVGIFLKIITILKNRTKINDIYLNRDTYKTNKFGIILVSLFFVLLIITRFSFRYNYLISLFTLLMCFIILLSLHNKLKINNHFAFSVMNLALFLIFLLVFSYMNIKCIRYILPAIPGFIYFVVYALENILDYIEGGFSINGNIFTSKKVNNKLISKLILIVLIILCIVVVCNFTNTVEIAERGNEVIDVCDFIIAYDPNYQSKNIGSCMERYFEWYLNKDLNLTHNVALNESNFTYIIYQKELNEDNYHLIYNTNSYFVYEKNN